MLKLFLFTLLLSTFSCKSEVKTLENPLAKSLVEKVDTSKNDLIIHRAKKHLGKPYLAHTLDKTKEEKLVVRLDGFDCTTLVETVVAEVNDANSIEAHITKTRYRNGVIEDYASRIHYFTEWIKENSNQGIVEDITSTIPCSKPFKFKVGYMSKNRTKYQQIATNNELLDKIKAMEDKVNSYEWQYIPKQSLPQCESYIKHGDIIAITTDMDGLDIAHLGFAHRAGKKLSLLHASTDEKKVVNTTKTLHQYLMSHKKQTGIMVLRLL